jgi:hypothetical protein
MLWSTLNQGKATPDCNDCSSVSTDRIDEISVAVNEVIEGLIGRREQGPAFIHNFTRRQVGHPATIHW